MKENIPCRLRGREERWHWVWHKRDFSEQYSSSLPAHTIRTARTRLSPNLSPWPHLEINTKSVPSTRSTSVPSPALILFCCCASLRPWNSKAASDGLLLIPYAICQGTTATSYWWRLYTNTSRYQLIVKKLKNQQLIPYMYDDCTYYSH